METKAGNAIITNSFSKGLYLKLGLWIVVGFFSLGGFNIIFAESFVRIEKNGIIHYYFAYIKENQMKFIHNPLNKHGRDKESLSRYQLSAQELEPWIKWASQNHSLPASLVKAVIRVESNFNPAATSPKGAQGLMQLMPGTAEQLQVSNPYNIQENIWGGARYLSNLIKKFNNNLPLALAAYNAGPRRVAQCKDIPPIKETQGFVRDVCANFLQYSKEASPNY